MTRRGNGSPIRLWMLALLALPLHADSALDVHTLFQNAAAALTDRKAAAFESAFDSSMPGFARLRSSVEALLKTNGVESTIEWQKNEGTDRNRTVQLNWTLEISQQGGTAAVTRRASAVQCRLANKGGAWKIVSFTPADFFVPPQPDEAWRVVQTAAMGLTEAAADASTFTADLPAVNTHKFMQSFDPSMPGFAQLRDNVLALEQSADIESGVDLTSNEGDDRVRTIVMDWSMNLVSRDTSVTRCGPSGMPPLPRANLSHRSGRTPLRHR